MKENRVGLVQGSGKERVSSGISIMTPFTLGITLDSTGISTLQISFRVPTPKR